MSPLPTTSKVVTPAQMAPPDIRISTLEEVKPGESWLLLLYGESKSGKTYFAGTCGPRTLYLNVGEGIETLKNPAFTSRYPDTGKMLTVQFPLSDTVETFERITRTIGYFLENRADEFDTIVLDEATAFRKHALDQATTLNGSARGRNRKDKFIQTELGDYKIEMDMIEWFLGEFTPQFKARKKHFVMLAHERQLFNKPAKQGDEQTLKKILPGFTGKTFPDKVPAYFDDVWHAEAVGKNPRVYRIQTAGSEKLLAGSRHGGIFAPEETDPNFLKMLERIKKQTIYVAPKIVTPPNTNKETK